MGLHTGPVRCLRPGRVPDVSSAPRTLEFGLAKNAGEGSVARLIVADDLLLLGGQVLPVVLLGLGLASIPGLGWRGVWRHGHGPGCGVVLSAAGGGPQVSSVRWRTRFPFGGHTLAGRDSVVCSGSKSPRAARQVEREGLSGATNPGGCSSGATTKVKKFPPRTITLDGRPINLTQVLKLGGCVQSGGEAKMLIAGGQIRVNGQVELRNRLSDEGRRRSGRRRRPTIVLLAGAPPEMATPPDDATTDRGYSVGTPRTPAREVILP